MKTVRQDQDNIFKFPLKALMYNALNDSYFYIFAYYDIWMMIF